jgi:CHAD domain-containing protein
MFELEADEAVEAGIKRILAEKIEETIGLLEFPDEDPAYSVHEARKNFKRLRAVLRLVITEIGRAHFRRENIFFRDKGRRLAPLRDSEVMLETYDLLDLAGYFENKPAGMAELRARLAGHKSAVHEAFFDDGAGFEEMLEALRKSRAGIEELPIRNTGFQALAGGFKRVYRRGRRRMVRAYDAEKDPHLFHEWRKRVKYLWHHLEILRPLDPVGISEKIDGLQQLSSLLGEAHDAAFLVEYLQVEAPYGGNEAARFVSKQALRHHAVMVENAQSLGNALYGPGPRAVVHEMSELWDAWGD